MEADVGEDELFQKGLDVRRQGLGAKYLDANLSGADDFLMGFQRLVTEWAWGYAWLCSQRLADRKSWGSTSRGLSTAAFRSMRFERS